ncbi:MAG: TolC family protein, partial [Candidatus Pacebacteria bacterium]|nr:TolC family protein [Candidatus Paceibacterota bacterium]
KSAFERVGDLQREARELVRLQVVPEYQLNQARLEVNLREEELLASREVLKVAAVELKQLTGIEISDALALSTSSFVDWAQTIVIRDDMPPTEAYARRGAWQQLANNIQASEAGVTLAREQLKPNIYLKTSVTYQGESFTDSFGDDALIDDDKVSGAVQLIYSQPLGYRRERAELAAEKAATSALREQQRALELRISSRLEANKIAFEISQKRLEIATRAADAAQATLEAEAERFRLGEGRSRQVLDAEKDLTATIRLQARNAARVLRAQTEHAFEAGYPETQ